MHAIRSTAFGLGLAVLAILPTLHRSYGAACDMALSFKQPDDNGARKVGVWSDPASKSLLFRESLHVNTDGTRRSYSVTDFWGSTVALNNLCNAMSDGCGGLDAAGLKARRILTQSARDKGWPPDMLARTKIASSIIPFKNGKPCPEIDGFLVSATALARPHLSNACDISNYVDALTVPAIVLPGRPKKGQPSDFEARNATVGDLAVVMAKGASKVIYAVVGDTGPAKELGEGSIGLNGALLGKTEAPANYDEIRGKGSFQGRGWDVGSAVVLILPGTRDTSDPYMTVPRIDAAAAPAFQRWGGLDRLKACDASYQP